MVESKVELIVSLIHRNLKKNKTKKRVFNLPTSKLSCQEVERNETSARTGAPIFVGYSKFPYIVVTKGDERLR